MRKKLKLDYQRMNEERKRRFIGDNDTFLEESGMFLIANNAFLIEEWCRSQKKVDGIKIVEMVLFKGEKLIFNEAKSTFPNPDSKESSLKFKEAVQKIVDKFIHSLELYCSVAIGIRRAEVASKIPQSSKGIIFLLIIRDHRKEWCKPIENGIKEQLPEHTKKIWKPEVYVLNYDMAMKKGFAVKDVLALT